MTGKGCTLSKARDGTFNNVVIIESHERKGGRGNDGLPDGPEHFFVEDGGVADHKFS
jgi:hypothetical protein